MELHVFAENEEVPMPPLPPIDNSMGNMGGNNMGILGAGPTFYGGPMSYGPMMGPGPSPDMMNMNQMMMFGGVSVNHHSYR